jgi:hypothetical protein
MVFAAGARHDISFVPEVTFGVTPTTPAMKFLRHTGTTLNLAKNAITSEEMYADGMIRDLRHGNRRVAGDINFELSYAALDDWLAAALGGTWATNVLKRGLLIPSFTVERRFNDVAQFLRYTGVAVNTWSLTVAPDALVSGSFGVVGKDLGPLVGTQLGAPTAVASHPPFDSFTGVITEGGATIASITQLAITVDNGLDPAFVIGSASTPQIIPGRRGVTGTVSAYFETAALLNKFIDETESSISVTLDGAVGGDLTISLPRIKYTGGDLPVTSVGGVTLSMPFTGLRDATSASNIVVTRIPAP